MRRRTILLVCGAAVLALLVWNFFSVGEVLEVIAISDSPVNLVRGSDKPPVIVLHAGDRLPIRRCVPHKTNIDIEVAIPNGAGVIKGSKFRVVRRPATVVERLSGEGTSSCFGLL
jgi:hypothetical protein